MPQPLAATRVSVRTARAASLGASLCASALPSHSRCGCASHPAPLAWTTPRASVFTAPPRLTNAARDDTIAASAAVAAAGAAAGAASH